MSYFDFETEAEISRHLVGKGERKVPYTVVWLPGEFVEQLNMADNPRLRIEGEINDHPFNGALQPAGDDRYYLMVPKPILKDAELRIGDSVELRFRVADQAAVDVPDALQNAISGDAELQRKWQDITPGKQRSFAYRVASAKTEATIQKRLDEVTHMLREGLSYTKGGKIK